MERVTIKTCGVVDRAAKLAELMQGPGPHFAVYTSDYDLGTGETWCPDCRRAVPAILDALAERKGSLLLIQVGPRDYWKSPNHPFKTDPLLKVKGVPTLVHLKADGGEDARISKELEDATTSEEAKQLAVAFMAKTSL